MNKCHSPIGWHNDTTPALNETNLNYMDGCIDTIDDRVVAMDSSKLESEDIEDVIVSVTMDDDTGIFTFTKYDGTTFTIDTKLEKIAVNFRYDTATQKLIITLDDGTTQEIDLSSLIQETDFSDSSTIVWTVTNHVASASIKANSIGDAQMQTGYLTDCQSAASTASTAATNANTSKLQSEGFSVGEQNGIPVGSSSPYYHNNAKYYAQQAGGTSLAGLTDVDITNPTDRQSLVYDSDNGVWVNGDSAPTINIVDNLNSTSSADALSANQGRVLNESIESVKDTQDMISDKWNPSTTYTVGAYCIDNNTLWRCKVQNSNTRPSEGTYWTAVSVANEIKEVKANVSAKPSALEERLAANVTTALRYLGLSITIPAGKNAIVWGTQWYSAAEPKQMSISTSDTTNNGTIQNGGEAERNFHKTYTARTVYLWGSANGAGINDCFITALIF